MVVFSRNGVVLSNVSHGGVDLATAQQLTRLVYEMLISQRSKFVATQLMQKSIVAIAKSSLAALLVFDGEAHSLTPLERTFTILLLNTILYLSGQRLAAKVEEFVQLQCAEEINVTATSSGIDVAARERLQEWFDAELAYVPALCEDTLFCEQFEFNAKDFLLLQTDST